MSHSNACNVASVTLTNNDSNGSRMVFSSLVYDGNAFGDTDSTRVATVAATRSNMATTDDGIIADDAVVAASVHKMGTSASSANTSTSADTATLDDRDDKASRSMASFSLRAIDCSCCCTAAFTSRRICACASKSVMCTLLSKPCVTADTSSY